VEVVTNGDSAEHLRNSDQTDHDTLLGIGQDSDAGDMEPHPDHSYSKAAAVVMGGLTTTDGLLSVAECEQGDDVVANMEVFSCVPSTDNLQYNIASMEVVAHCSSSMAVTALKFL